MRLKMKELMRNMDTDYATAFPSQQVSSFHFPQTLSAVLQLNVAFYTPGVWKDPTRIQCTMTK